MDLPWYQVAADWMTRDAPTVANLLRAGNTPLAVRDVQRVIGLGCLLFAYAVDKTWNSETPPDGVFLGPGAGDRLEAAVQWDGPRGALIEAFVTADVIERLDGGLRVRGCERYESLWRKNQHKPGRHGRKRDGRGTNAPARGSHAHACESVAPDSGQNGTDAHARGPHASASAPVDGDGDVDRDSKSKPIAGDGAPAGQQPLVDPAQTPAAPANIALEPSQALLMPVAEQPAKRTKRARADAPPTSPHFKPLSDRLVEGYRRAMGCKYIWNGSVDGEAVKRLCVAVDAGDVTVEELGARFERSLSVDFNPTTGIANFAPRSADPRWQRGSTRAEDQEHGPVGIVQGGRRG